MSPSFEDLVSEAATVPVEGWDFSWLGGRATEERPSWGYQELLARRLPQATAALDVQTGGGEVLAGALTGTRTGTGPAVRPVPARRPAVLAATESWAPNVAVATALLHPLGAVVVADEDEPPLPFADSAFDLVTSRHPVTVQWEEIARVLRPGGTYLSQQVGPASVFELVEYFLGPQPAARRARDPEEARRGARAAGLEVVDLRAERLRMEFHDVGAVVYFLRKVIWMVPGFTPERERDRLRRLHEQITAEGPFVAHSSRFLIEARKPDAARPSR
ncbi:methyltransferase domain-containing protein [Streptomyces sp. NPDC059740]|uniref:methyltransferase domain-containing protein n=1 Tax=Streptomyces sp. NPDC059740 TaxID=3346926 RepID=UPI00366A47C3